MAKYKKFSHENMIKLHEFIADDGTTFRKLNTVQQLLLEEEQGIVADWKFTTAQGDEDYCEGIALFDWGVRVRTVLKK